MSNFFDILDKRHILFSRTPGGNTLIEGDVDLSGSDLTSLPDNLLISGSLLLRDCALSALPRGLEIMDDLDARNTPITELPPDMGVGRSVMMENTRLKRLPETFVVIGNLDLEGSPIETLPRDLVVKGYLNLRDTQISTLPTSWFVEGPLLLAEHEGWSWSEGRLQSVKRWGEDSERYRLLPSPEVCDEEATGALEDALDAVCLEIESCEDRGEETSDTLRLLWEKQASTEDLLRERRSAVQMRAWSEEVKASAGVVVSFDNGAIKVQRGIMRTDDDVSANMHTVDDHASNAAENAVAIDKPSQCTMYSASLLRSLTAERTLAVQAALAKNPDVALVFVVHTLLLQFFGKLRSDILRVNVENKRTELLTHIGEKAETRKAIIALTECENEVIQRLPDNWKEDSSFLLCWSQEALINLLALCVIRGIDGVTDKIDNHGKASDKLSLLESALDFSLSDWWQPDSDNFFSRISKESISECLKNAGHETEAKQALTLKKSDAAQLAAQTVNDTGWLPDCLVSLSTADSNKTS